MPVTAARLWHVTVTVGGDWQPSGDVHAALGRLQTERPFMSSLRYDEHRAEASYWEEGATIVDATSLAMRLWTDHRDSAALPDWEVLGLTVRHRELHERLSPSPGLVEVDAGPRPF